MVENTKELVYDVVQNPKHYAGSTSLECIDVMELVLGKRIVKGFCLGNAFKYLWRYMNKNGKQDLDKTEWYLNKYLELCLRSKKPKISEKHAMLVDLLKNARERLENNG